MNVASFFQKMSPMTCWCLHYPNSSLYWHSKYLLVKRCVRYFVIAIAPYLSFVHFKQGMNVPLVFSFLKNSMSVTLIYFSVLFHIYIYVCVCVCVCVCVFVWQWNFHLEVEVAIMKIGLEGKKDFKKYGIYLPTKSPRLTNEELIIIQ